MYEVSVTSTNDYLTMTDTFFPFNNIERARLQWEDDNGAESDGQLKR